MSRLDLAERLSQMVADAEKRAGVQQQTIARQHATNSMLNSGNFFIAEKQALETIYQDTLQNMEEHALNVVAPSDAGSAVKVAGVDLETKFLARFEWILRGAASGNPCPEKASEELLSDFRAFAREQLNQTVSDTINNVAGKPVRGWKGWVGRYGWNAANTIIAALALYWSWGKK